MVSFMGNLVMPALLMCPTHGMKFRAGEKVRLKDMEPDLSCFNGRTGVIVDPRKYNLGGLTKDAMIEHKSIEEGKSYLVQLDNSSGVPFQNGRTGCQQTFTIPLHQIESLYTLFDVGDRVLAPSRGRGEFRVIKRSPNPNQVTIEGLVNNILEDGEKRYRSFGKTYYQTFEGVDFKYLSHVVQVRDCVVLQNFRGRERGRNGTCAVVRKVKTDEGIYKLETNTHPKGNACVPFRCVRKLKLGEKVEIIGGEQESLKGKTGSIAEFLTDDRRYNVIIRLDPEHYIKNKSGKITNIRVKIHSPFLRVLQ